MWTKGRMIIGCAAAVALGLTATWVVLAQMPVGTEHSRLGVDCREATNGCEVCRIDAGGRSSCSLPGIACQPSSWRCIKVQAAPSDSPRSERPETR